MCVRNTLLRRFGLTGLLCCVAWACSGSPSATSVNSEPVEQARLLMAEQAYGPAAELLMPLAQAGSSDPDLYVLLGRIAAHQQNWPLAVQHFEQTITLDPDHAAARLALARVFLAAGHYDQARGQIDAVLRREPRHPEARLLMAAQLLARGDVGQAEGLLAEMVTADSAPADAFQLLAAARARQNDAGGVIQALTEGLGRYPGHNALRLELAGHHWTLGQTAAADELIGQLQRQSPADGSNYPPAADFYLQRNQPARAEAVLLDGLAARPGAAAIHLALNRFHAVTGQARKGIEVLLTFLGGEHKPEGQALRAVQLALAQAYFQQREMAPAARFVEQVLESDPTAVEGLYLRGRIAAATGQWSQAVSAFQAVLSARPDLAEVYLLLARLYTAQGDPTAAANLLGAAVDRFPAQRELHLALAQAHLNRGDYKAAEARMVHWLRIEPADIQLQADLGDFYLSLRDAHRAEREYAEIVRKAPDHSLGYLKLARLYVARGEHAAAVAELSAGYARLPGATDLPAELVRTHLAAGDAKAALALTRERLARNADEPFAHHLQGLVHTHQGSPKEAARAFEQAAALDPQWTEPVNHLAALLLTQNKQADAARQLEAGLERNPRNPAAYLTLARIQEEARQYPAAIALYERALEVIPDFGEAAARLALLLCERNAGPEDLYRALSLTSEAYRRNPGRVDILQAIAWVHYTRGAHDKALALLLPIAERAPDDPLLNYHLGMALLKSGQPEKARGKLELALQEKTPFVGRADAEQALKTLKASRS
jgi:tetratricopeptide (TPR) repeat protein